jgi:Protein of unknown function (DUF2628)
MAVYTVHEPLPRGDEVSSDPERFVFVRDGFYFWAFLFGPLWMLWRGLWLVTVLFFALTILLQVGLWAISAPDAAKAAVALLLALLIGFEAGTLRRWTLARRGWKNVGVVVGDSLESAERRFYAGWTLREPQATPPTLPTQNWPAPPKDNGILGLFPEPGAPR